MARKFPTDVLEQAISMQGAWAKIDEQLTVGDLNIAALVMDINQIRQAEDELVVLLHELTELRNRRDAFCQAAWDKVRRMRAAIKGIYGFDSTQYELAGGTPTSERKPARRTAPAPVE